jgi:hypothetical protein
MYTSRIENPMVVGAAAQYDAMCAIGERLEAATESELEQLLADEGSVEEAISQNADLVRVAIDELAADPSRGAEIVERLQRMIRGYLEPWATNNAERSL